MASRCIIAPGKLCDDTFACKLPTRQLFQRAKIQYASINRQEQLSNGFLNDVNQARVKRCHRSILKGLLLNLTILVLGTSPLLECCVSIEAYVIWPFQACNLHSWLASLVSSIETWLEKLSCLQPSQTTIIIFPAESMWWITGRIGKLEDFFREDWFDKNPPNFGTIPLFRKESDCAIFHDFT